MIKKLTELATSRFSRLADDEPIAGYRLITPLGVGGFGEVWKCSAPGGLLKAMKIVTLPPLHESETTPARHEHEAMNRIKQIRHPFLISVERVDQAADELFIVMELADHSLLDEYEHCRAAGHAGIDQAQLLHNLHEAAEVLDVMNFQHGLQHLDVKPANLLICNRHLKLADFGLVSSIADYSEGSGQGFSCCFTPRDASPELLQGTISSCCDQYSLAIAYQELLTGSVPYEGSGLLSRIIKAPNLALLPEADRPIMIRALSPDPAERYPSCLDFVRALLAACPATPPLRDYRPLTLDNVAARRPAAAQAEAGTATLHTAGASLIETPPPGDGPPNATVEFPLGATRPEPSAETQHGGVNGESSGADVSTRPGVHSPPIDALYPPTIHFSDLKWRPSPSGEVAPELDEFLAGLLAAETVQPPPRASQPMVSFLELAGDGLEKSFLTPSLAAPLLRLKFDKMIKACRGELMLRSERFVVFAVEGTIPFWKLFSSKQRILKVTVRLEEMGEQPAGLCKTTVRIEAFDPDGFPLEPSLRNIRQLVLSKIQSVLGPAAERRKHKRLACNFRVKLFPVLSDWRFDQVVEAHAFDLSVSGIGLIAPISPATQRVYVRPSAPAELSDFAVLAEIVRNKQLPNGSYELGAAFGPL